MFFFFVRKMFPFVATDTQGRGGFFNSKLTIITEENGVGIN